MNIIHIQVIKGFLPNRQLRLILAWATIHQDELMQNWELSRDKKPLNRINPLILGGVVMQEYFPVVVQVIPREDFHVQVFFDDGKIVEYDITDELESEIFQPLKNIRIFMDTCTVMNDTLAWDLARNRNSKECIDIDPFVLYELPSINNLMV